MEAIKDHALIGDCRAAALVSRGGAIDWLCWPRFDSPSVFGAILDDRAGHWTVRPTSPFESTQRYLDGTNVLETRFVTGGGSVVITDLMPVASEEDKLSEATLTKAIEHALEAYMGRPIATTLRTLDQLKAIVEGNPFAKVATKPAYLCVTFLSHAPTKADVAPLHGQDWKPELFNIAGKEIYTWYPNGQGRSPLAAALGKLALRGAVTTRNWNTVQKLVEMLEDG